MRVNLKWIIKQSSKTSRVVLTFEERYKNIGCQVCKVSSGNIFWKGQLRRSPRKSSRWVLFPGSDNVTSIRWAQLRITFSLRKRMTLESPKCSVWLLSFEPGPNQARTRTSVLSGPGQDPCRPVVQTTRALTCDHALSRVLSWMWTVSWAQTHAARSTWAVCSSGSLQCR
jgi:hypothetical protein